jgi:hypothetical protein
LETLAHRRQADASGLQFAEAFSSGARDALFRPGLPRLLVLLG